MIFTSEYYGYLWRGLSWALFFISFRLIVVEDVDKNEMLTSVSLHF